MKSFSTMSKVVYVIGIVLLWLVAGIGVVWWTFTTFAIFEAQWAMLVTAVFLIVVLFTSLVLIRMWRWIWLSSNTREIDD
jgi:membrane protein YdbS with pleckstrin-like domain